MDPEPSKILLDDLAAILMLLQASDFSNFILLAFLLLCSGLFSGSEIAIFSLTPADMEDIAEDKSKSALALVWFRNQQKRLLALLLICNTFVNIGIAIVVERILSNVLPVENFNSLAAFTKNVFLIQIYTVDQISYLYYFVIAVLGSAALILIFGEIMPKIYGLLNRKSLSLFMALPLRVLDFFLMPLTWFLVTLTHRVEKKLVEKKVGLQSTTREDLDAAVDLAISSDLESDRQVDILKGIIKFNNVSAKQVMTSRTDIFGLELGMKFNEVLSIIRDCGFSRLPVFHEDFDRITGILYVKDLIAHLDKDENFEWQKLIRTNTLYIPESRKIHEVLKDFQSKQLHMGFVVDEYGGISGLVTLEDIMEEIVGEIKDEFDEQHELNFVKLDNNNFLFDGKTLINDMCRALGVDIYQFDDARGNADTVAGLFLENTGEMPRKDQEVIIKGYKFKAVSVNKRRIEKVKVTVQ